jgi:lysophospholipase L1-like esterase
VARGFVVDLSEVTMKRKLTLQTVATSLVLMGVGAILALVLAEAALTAANIAPSRPRGRSWGMQNEAYGWGYRPGATFTYDGRLEKFGAPGKINSNGLREREYAYEKPDGVYRILILGDSFTASLEVPLEQTWHELLEEALNTPQSARRVEVIAAGIQGWSTDQEYLYYMHEGHKYRPDLILVQFYPNDIYGNGVEVQRLTRVPTETDKPFFVLEDDGRLMLTDPFRTERMAPQAAPAGSPVQRAKTFLRTRLRTYRLVAQVRQARQGGQRVRVPFCYEYDGVPPELLTYAPRFTAEYQAAWDVTARIFEELKNDAGERGQRLAVLYMPDRRQVIPREWQRTLECWPAAAPLSWDLDRPNRLLDSHLAGLTTPYLDLTESFRRAIGAGQSVYFETDWHLNPPGHRFVAAMLADWLRARSLVPE